LAGRAASEPGHQQQRYQRWNSRRHFSLDVDG
jgi:hypothetical protein